VPPPVRSARVIVCPTHTVPGPVIGNGIGLTVTVYVRLQPVGNVYTITAVPGFTPNTIPVDEPTVALPLDVVHVPPGLVGQVSVVVLPTHIEPEGVATIAPGRGLTVKIAIERQPAPIVYLIVSSPGVMPHAIPVAEPTVPIAVKTLLHTPPGVLQESDVQDPTQTLVVPVIGAVVAFTVTTAVVEQPCNDSV